MKRLFIILSIILLINSYYANSQIEYSVDKWMEYVEELALETEDTERIESLYADLSYLIEHPFDLNAVTEEQLKRLPFYPIAKSSSSSPIGNDTEIWLASMS